MLDRIAWWENTAGDATAWTRRTVDNAFLGAADVAAADLDADGDLDLLGAGRTAGTEWWENTLGDGTAWVSDAFDSGFTDVIRVQVADMDRDGDLDPVGSSNSLDDIVWWPNRGGQFALPTADAVEQSAPIPGASDVLLLRIDASHRGRTGDGDLELVTFELLFEESAGDPLTGSELDAQVSTVRIYRDDGDGTFEIDGSDTNFHSVAAPFTLVSGVLTTTFVDGESDVQVAFGTDEIFFVAVDLQADSDMATVATLRLTHVTSSSSTAEMSSTDIPLALEFQADTSATTLFLQSALNADSQTLEFGSQPVDDGPTAALDVTATNDSAASLTIDSVTLTGAASSEFTITADTGETTLGPGETRTLSVAFDPTSAGDKTAALALTYNDGSENTLEVALEGRGIQPEISVSDADLTFGDQSITAGATAQQTLTITNDGEADLTITSVALGGDSGDFPIVSDSGETTLGAGETRTLDFGFDPTALGSRAAVLTILSDAANGTTTQVDLTGNGTAAEVTLAPNPLDFVDQLVGTTSAVSTVSFTNDGTVDITIASVSLVGTDAAEFNLVPGTYPAVLGNSASEDVDVTFGPSTTGLKAATLRFLLDDGAIIDVDLSGRGVAPEVDVSPESFDFGGHSITSTNPLEQTITLTNTVGLDLTIVSATLTDNATGDFTLPEDSGEAVLLADEARTFVVAFDPSSTGSRSAVLRIQTVELGDVDVDLDGTGTEPEIDIVPLLLDFGDQSNGAGVGTPQTVTLTNGGDGPLVISSVVLAGTDASDFTISSDSGEVTLGPAEIRTLEVAFDPTTAGTKAATLRVVSDDLDEGVLGVALDGRGTVPEITVVPVSLDFGSVDVGGGPSASQTVTITNDGTETLSLTGIQLSGDGAGEFLITAGGVTPVNLEPSESHPVDIAFVPVSSGTHSAELQVLSNDPDEPSVSVGLAGNTGILIFSDGFEGGSTDAWAVVLP